MEEDVDSRGGESARAWLSVMGLSIIDFRNRLRRSRGGLRKTTHHEKIREYCSKAFYELNCL